MWSGPSVPAKPRTTRRPFEKARVWVQPFGPVDVHRVGFTAHGVDQEVGGLGRARIALGYEGRVGYQERLPSGGGLEGEAAEAVHQGRVDLVVLRVAHVAAIDRVGHDQAVDPGEVLGHLEQGTHPPKPCAEGTDHHAADPRFVRHLVFLERGSGRVEQSGEERRVREGLGVDTRQSFAVERDEHGRPSGLHKRRLEYRRRTVQMQDHVDHPTRSRPVSLGDEQRRAFDAELDATARHRLIRCLAQ